LIRRPERWQIVVPRTPVEPDRRLHLTPEREHPATHLRLVAYPDGALARLRVYGAPLASADVVAGKEVDLAAITAGGLVVDCSDAHFGSPTDMLVDEGAGWLTRRRRDDRHDWAVVRLAGRGELRRMVVDTRGFVGNAPAACSVEGISSEAAGDLRAADWRPILDRTSLRADHRHEFSELRDRGPFTHLRLSIHPDGGIRRFSVIGTATSGWHRPRPEIGTPDTR
jgi:allantoicase